MTRQELIVECKRQYNEKRSVDEIVGYLRGVGCSKIESMAIIVASCQIDLAAAKKSVHFSSTWIDTKKPDELFHETILNVLSTSVHEKS